MTSTLTIKQQSSKITKQIKRLLYRKFIFISVFNYTVMDKLFRVALYTLSLTIILFSTSAKLVREKRSSSSEENGQDLTSKFDDLMINLNKIKVAIYS